LRPGMVLGGLNTTELLRGSKVRELTDAICQDNQDTSRARFVGRVF
jgi:hypothetical protein